MYYSVPTLHSIAQDFYVSGEGVELLPFTSDQTGGKADAILKPGQIIHFRHTGKVRLHFHTHGWSGKVTIHAGGKSSEHDLYSQAPGELWVDFDVEGEAISDLVIVSGSARNPASSGSQVWLRGVEVEKNQPWHPAVLPISPVAEAVIGKVGTFIVPHFDEVIGNSIKNTGIWAEKDIEFFSDVVRQGDTVLDIGANIGHHTVFFSKAVGISGRVIAFEPQLNIFRFASANLVVNGAGNTTLLQGCLGDACGELRMAPVSYDRTTNFGALGVSIGESSEGEIAPVWTLDSLVADGTIKLDRIDFVKIDVQSFELFVLRGAEQTLRKFKPKIFLEISPFWMEARGYSYVTIYEFLAEMGYSFQHFSEGAGIKDGIRQWSGVETEEWDVFCCAT